MADSTQSTSSDFTVDQLDYSLPEELIAQHPLARREDARLLVVDRASGALRDSRITELPSLLRPGDLLVLNDTKVVPAKFLARRKSGGKVPGLYLQEVGPGTWEVLLEGSRRLKVGESLKFEGPSERSSTMVHPCCHAERSAVPPAVRRPGESEILRAVYPQGRAQNDEGAGACNNEQSVPGTPCAGLELLERLREGRWRVRVSDPRPAAAILQEYGETPLPPYINRHSEGRSEFADRDRYQTVYARQPGAVAAPTAGLHLTEALLQQIKERGVEVATVTLHVGLGTFKPIGTARLSDHVMHQERYEVSTATLAALRACRARGGRIVAVGTTTVRVLETIARGEGIEGSRDQGIEGKVETSKSQKVENIQPGIRGTTDIFIHPPHPFRLVDALLTNFHLPRSTLLALVMAFAGIDLTRRAYGHAMAGKYRFYSYGDAMLIL